MPRLAERDFRPRSIRHSTAIPRPGRGGVTTMSWPYAAAPEDPTQCAAALQKHEEVQIEKRDSSYYVPVRINDTIIITLPFL